MGTVSLLNIVIIFLLIMFALLAATLSYSKAFQVNSRILTTIEKYEGYNPLSEQEINHILETLGYKTGSSNCPKRNGVKATSKYSDKYDYCIYYSNIDEHHYKYGITTYITLDLPLIRQIRLPIYTETERIYRFTNK